MTENDTELDRYREAFATLAEDAGATEGCPDTETIYRAVSGELSAAEVAEIVDHLSECASCAQAWTVARQMAPAAVESTEPSLGPEMKSTGEVMGIDTVFPNALYKAFLASGTELKQIGRLLIIVAPAVNLYIGFKFCLRNSFRDKIIIAAINQVICLPEQI